MARGKRGKGAYISAEGIDGIAEAVANLRVDGRLAESSKPHLDALRLWLESWVLPPLDRVLRDAGRELPQNRAEKK